MRWYAILDVLPFGYLVDWLVGDFLQEGLIQFWNTSVSLSRLCPKRRSSTNSQVLQSRLLTLYIGVKVRGLVFLITYVYVYSKPAQPVSLLRSSVRPRAQEGLALEGNIYF